MIGFIAAVSFVGSPWFVPMAAAANHKEPQDHSASQIYTNADDLQYANREYDDPSRARAVEESLQTAESVEQYGASQRQYDKAMKRLAREERQAREQAYREYNGNTAAPLYLGRIAEIERTYAEKRAKVERRAAQQQAQETDAVAQEHENSHNDWNE
jgi:hypothetical protein